MKIAIDSREKPHAIVKIREYFDKHGIKHFVNKLPVGDYMDFDYPRISIDRKQSLLEVAKNVCQDHERFRRELLRAQDLDIKLILLIEHSHTIKTLSDVRHWRNPRRIVSPYALEGYALYDRLLTIQNKYKVPIYFCTKRETGAKIIELLQNNGKPYEITIKNNKED